MIEVSIVSGTYNRLRHLKNMVESIRRSVKYGLPYEIVLVDGGSTDGTIPWCKSQSDVVLIEQGELLGAVKAFNAGAMAAKGRYVILANDDIEFIDEAILSGFSFMQDNLDVGVGCFYQDRYKLRWHVEQMPAIRNNRQVSAWYGQVCIVPKWLGDKVGWWGDYLHTYGGDNELSCNILELGYKVLPVPCAMIHDTTPEDDLRRINNSYDVTTNNHPDTQMWLDKWRKGKLVGPIIKSQPDEPKYLDRTLRIFYTPIYEPGHNIQQTTKRGLRSALAKVGLVVEYDYMNEPVDLMFDVSCSFDADIFIMQLQDANRIDVATMKALRAQHSDATFVNWNGDYHPELLYSDEYILLAKTFDYVGLVTTCVEPTYKKYNINSFYWQIGYEEVKDSPAPREHFDVVYLANCYSDKRTELGNMLRSLANVKTGLYGHWPEWLNPNGENVYNFQAGANIYRSSKLAISDSQWPMATGFVSNRLFQAMDAGVLLLQQEFDGLTELLGLKDGEHLVTWSTMDDLQDKIRYWLEHDDERVEVMRRGQQYVRTNHSFDTRVEELMNRIYM